jgi:hypothetical protein
LNRHWEPFPRGYTVKLTTHLQSMDLYIHCPYAFMVQCLIKHRDNFTLTSLWIKFGTFCLLICCLETWKLEYVILAAVLYECEGWLVTDLTGRTLTLFQNIWIIERLTGGGENCTVQSFITCALCQI